MLRPSHRPKRPTRSKSPVALNRAVAPPALKECNEYNSGFRLLAAAARFIARVNYRSEIKTSLVKRSKGALVFSENRLGNRWYSKFRLWTIQILRFGWSLFRDPCDLTVPLLSQSVLLPCICNMMLSQGFPQERRFESK